MRIDLAIVLRDQRPGPIGIAARAQPVNLDRLPQERDRRRFFVIAQMQYKNFLHGAPLITYVTPHCTQWVHVLRGAFLSDEAISAFVALRLLTCTAQAQRRRMCRRPTAFSQ